MFAPDVRERTLDMFDRAQMLGLDGIEILLDKPAAFPADAVRTRALDSGITAETFAVMLGVRTNLIDVDPTVRRAGVDYLRSCIDVVHRTGGTTMSGAVHAAYGHFSGAMATADEWQWAAEGLRRAGEYAAEAGIALGVEPINRYKMYFINTADEGRRMVDAVGLPNVGLVLDTFHMNIEEGSIGGAIRTAGDRLLGIHLNENHRGIPGTGHLPWPEVFAALGAIGYDGWGLIESVVPEMPEMAALFTTWRKVAPSTEAIITGGLEFFRYQASGVSYQTVGAQSEALTPDA
jgi:D-psicose/D-tagatose/L-ribulose 3-epimerase